MKSFNLLILSLFLANSAWAQSPKISNIELYALQNELNSHGEFSGLLIITEGIGKPRATDALNQITNPKILNTINFGITRSAKTWKGDTFKVISFDLYIDNEKQSQSLLLTGKQNLKIQKDGKEISLPCKVNYNLVDALTPNL